MRSDSRLAAEHTRLAAGLEAMAGVRVTTYGNAGAKGAASGGDERAPAARWRTKAGRG